MSLPSPNEERAPSGEKQKRRGGRGFYRDRDLPYSEKKRPQAATAYRDRHRAPADREAARLARELGGLAERFPRFRTSLYRLQHHVLVQARSEEWKSKTVLACLHSEPALVEEIVEDTGLDKQSANETLELLATKGSAERCTRDGAAVVIRKDGKPAERVYWKGRGQVAGAGGR